MDGIFAGLQGEVDVAGHALRIQASGGAVLSKVRESDVDAMIVKADLALYKAKELGKNGWRLFESSMDAAFRNKQLMKADLRSARRNEQPARRLPADRRHRLHAHLELRGALPLGPPDLGPISPAIFIPLAEEMGIISEISTFMLDAASRRMRQVAGADQRLDQPVGQGLPRPRHRRQGPRSARRVRPGAAQAGDRGHRDRAARRQVADGRTHRGDEALGVRIALDDFGTGYSSLSYLHKLPLDKVKIDRSFLMDVTQNERSLELLQGVVDLSRRLGLQVTIEGVETFEQLKILAAAGQAGPGAGLPVRLGAVGFGHRDHVEHRLAVRQEHPHRQARRAPLTPAFPCQLLEFRRHWLRHHFWSLLTIR